MSKALRPQAVQVREQSAEAARRAAAVREHLAEAAALEASGEVWAAAGCFRKALALEPSAALALEGIDRLDSRQLQVRALVVEAAGLEQQHNLWGAIGAYRKALSLDPACMSALEAIDRLRMDSRLGAVDDALQALSSASSGDSLIERVRCQKDFGFCLMPNPVACGPGPSTIQPDQHTGAPALAADKGGR